MTTTIPTRASGGATWAGCCATCPAKRDIERFIRDISDDPVYLFFDKYFLLLQVILGVVLYALGGWSFVIWGIFVRLVVVYHCTWFREQRYP